MNEIESLLNTGIYSLKKNEKNLLLTSIFSKITNFHYQNCAEYKNIIDFYNIKPPFVFSKMEEIPFLPIRMLKEFELLSVERDQIVKVLTSSGTSGQKTSRIFLDAYTAKLQQKVLLKIVGDLIGPKRLPMIIVDSSEVLKNKEHLSARGAGILGFSLFASEKIYALDKEMKIDVDLVLNFIEKNKNQPILLFGFTYIVWLHFYQELLKLPQKIDLSGATLIHGGGWKKLINSSVTPKAFKAALFESCGMRRVYDYYGMAEQTGSIYTECDQGHLHTSIFSDVIIRNPIDFSVCNNNQEGLVQVLSIIPNSYPGHSLLTEDMGVLLGEDDCLCGKKGKYFKILGRMQNAEIRGCSDTYTNELR